MSSKPAQNYSLERVASRRNIVRGAAWTTAAVTVVVATPNIAAASVGTGCTVTGTRNGSNFYASVGCGTKVISSVQIGSVVATPNGPSYHAKLSGNAADIQTVTIVTNQGNFTQQVTFTIVPGSAS